MRERPATVAPGLFTLSAGDGSRHRPDRPRPFTPELAPPQAERRRSATRSRASASRSPDRVMYPDPGLTKLDVARYYEAVADGDAAAPRAAARSRSFTARRGSPAGAAS